MRVIEVMVGTPASCTTSTNLGAATEIMWNRNCGILPILDNQGEVIGVITDRDICIALGTQNRRPGEITVGEVASGQLFYCRPEDDIRAALATMAEKKVRRLPVMNAEGKLRGILSMDDVIVHSEARKPGNSSELSNDDVVDTLKRLSRPQLPELVRRKTAGAV